MSALNKRCPCGSGKKYKNCCMAKEGQQARPAGIPDRLRSADGFYRANRLDEAEGIYDEILRAAPRNKIALHRLSLIATHRRDYPRAEALLKKVIKLEPKNPGHYSNLGCILQEDNRPEEAIAVLTRAISLQPDFKDAYLNRANSLTVQGRIDAAIADYRRALKIDPSARLARSNMVYTMNYSPSLSDEEVFEAHRECARRIAPAAVHAEHANSPEPGRRLRIGYLSSDFREHSVSYFVAPVLEAHEREHFEIYGYYTHVIDDPATARIRQACDHWREVARLSDPEVLRRIRDDGIDILVDLVGYTAYGRPEVLATKPAPVQCEWLGYPNTTALSAMDYWICDAVANPPGMTDGFYTESLLRLPGCFICFGPPRDLPEPAGPPCGKNGYVTFGSFNNYAKVSEELLRIWAGILDAVPDSRLLLKSACLGNEAQRRFVAGFFERQGIAADRLLLEGYEQSRRHHMQKYDGMDVALDTFPYNGTTTTCEALWMGVPVVTLAGGNHRSRVGKTLLECVGLGELVAGTEEDYTDIAVQLGTDRARLQDYRSGLREAVASSPLTDATTFTSSLETAYRSIWEVWCNRQPASGDPD